ncbi:MAG: HAD family hydrolase [Aurantibacter sp.]
MKYKCVIFDCDGVLVDSEIITAKVLISMAGSLGLQLDLDLFAQEFMGRSLNDIMCHLDGLTNGHLPPNFESEYRRRTYKAFKTELKPIDGIHSVLENLKVPFCVASSGPLEKIRNNLTTTGLIDAFQDRMFSCYEIQRWKPNPDIFLYAAKNMGFKPNECIVIEDSAVGVQAALAGGFDVFIYSKKGHADYADMQKTIVFENMGELDTLLSRSMPD